MLDLRVPQIRYQAQIEQAFQHVGFLKKFYVLCSENRINPGNLNFCHGAVRRARPRKIFCAIPEICTTKVEQASFCSIFLHFLQKDPCFVSGRKGAGLGFSILLVVSMRGWCGREGWKSLCVPSQMLNVIFPKFSKNRQTSVTKVFAELPEPHLFVSDYKLACSESKVGPIKISNQCFVLFVNLSKCPKKGNQS